MDIRTVAETGSTNADVLALARSGAAEGLWLRAERQSAGRGRQGREWVSPPGNLHATALVRLRRQDPPAATLALVAGVAVQEAAGVHLREPERATIKWPNDLMADGTKLAGLLLEREGDAVAAGFGVNLAHHPDLPGRPATDLGVLGAPVAPDAFLATLTESFARWLATWRGQGVAPVAVRWAERAHPRGTALAVRLPDGTTLEGLFDGLASDGALLLRLADGGGRVIHAADVFLI